MFVNGWFEPELFSNFLARLVRENDRAAVLIGIGAIDEILALVLTKTLVDSKESKELIFGSNAPIGTFSSRIKLAYALGLISKDYLDELNVLRKIRNEMAHSWRDITLEDEPFSAKCNKLKLVPEQIPNAPVSARSCINCSIAILSNFLIAKAVGSHASKRS